MTLLKIVLMHSASIYINYVKAKKLLERRIFGDRPAPLGELEREHNYGLRYLTFSIITLLVICTWPIK